MSDPLDTATNLAKSKAVAAAKTAALGVASSVAATAVGAKAMAIASNPALNKLKKIPITKDPELLKQQAKAEAQKIVGEKQNELQQIKEKKIEEMKDKVGKLASLAAGAISLFIKLPIIDPKLIATIAFLKAQKELREAKQKMSKENLKKAKESFTYPIKPSKQLPQIPKLPEIPKVPEIPKIPTPPESTYIKTPPFKPSSNNGIDSSGFGAEDAAKAAAARKAVRREEIIKIQEDRVDRAKRFVDFQAGRLSKSPDDPDVQSSYNNAVKVYDNLVAYLEKVKTDSNITELME